MSWVGHDRSEMDAPAGVDNTEIWHTVFGPGHPKLKSYQSFNRRLPSPPRCKLCYAPFKGAGGLFMKLRGRAPSNRNPRYCSLCDKFIRAFPGGAEVVTSLAFVDIRGSTRIAERLSPTAFSNVLNQFYRQATAILNEGDGFIIDLVGDEVVALFPPGFSGERHAALALDAARRLVGMDVADGLGGRLEFGVGVNTGLCYIGTVGAQAEAGVMDVRAVGDVVNTAARLASEAAAYEVLATEQLWSAAGLSVEGMTTSRLEVKGKSEPLTVLRISGA